MARRVPRTASGALRLTMRRDLARPLEQPVVLDDLGDEPELVRPLRAHALVPARERDAHRDVGRQRAREPHHLAARHQADAHVRVEELGPIGRDHDVAGRDPVEARAAAQPVDRGEDRLGHRAERRRAFLRRFPLRVRRQVRLVVDDAPVVGDLGDVGAGAERAPVAGDDRDPDVVVGLGRRRTPARSSRIIAGLSALSRSGRSKVIVAMRSSTS